MEASHEKQRGQGHLLGSSGFLDGRILSLRSQDQLKEMQFFGLVMIEDSFRHVYSFLVMIEVSFG